LEDGGHDSAAGGRRVSLLPSNRDVDPDHLGESSEPS
jgi:hypothetical protein